MTAYGPTFFLTFTAQLTDSLGNSTTYAAEVAGGQWRVTDAQGNTATKVDSTGTTTYAWDYENRLTSVTLPGSGGAVSFKYDPFGRRIYKSSSAGTSIYAYDGDNLIEETNSTGAVVARYEGTQNIDEPLAMLRSSTTSYYEADGLGSITSLSSSAGALSNTYTYSSFGNIAASTGSLTNSLRYAARDFDAETGLYFNRARYYDTNAGRFIGEDPVRFQGGQNFYTYVDNMATSLIDPFGLAPNDPPPPPTPRPPKPPPFSILRYGTRMGLMAATIAIPMLVTRCADRAPTICFCSPGLDTASELLQTM